jgi:hypothetical protein
MPSNYDGGPYRRKAQPPAVDAADRLRQLSKTFRASPKRDQVGLCAGCPHAERCKQGRACAALKLRPDRGLASPYAPQAALSGHIRRDP